MICAKAEGAGQVSGVSLQHVDRDNHELSKPWAGNVADIQTS
jgi:hypothetical protein